MVASDLWTFSVFVPADAHDDAAPHDPSATPASAAAAATPKTKKLIQLQRALEEDDPRKSTVMTRMSAGAVKTLHTTAAEDGSFPATDERTSLLQGSGDAAASKSGASVVPSSPTGWTLSSPFWSLQSSILLKMTYKPAWQVLPDYTNRKCKTSSSSMLGSIGSTLTAGACCCCCSVGGSDPYHSITFTTADICHVETISNVSIRGLVGECSGIRLHLKYPENCFEMVVPSNVPQAYQTNWTDQLEHAKLNNPQQQQQGQPDGGNNNNFLHQVKQEIDSDLSASVSDSLPPTQHTAGPTITFAMPKDTAHADDEPPLVWKVELPAPSGGPIALESLTILDGPLLWSQQTPTTKQQQQQQPTHIYVNGFQSWSFAGSIPIGQKQPKSAMPNMFSKAFNHGGTLPPASLEFVPASTYDNTNRTTNIPIYNRSTPDATYVSDFFTCISSHPEEDDDDDDDGDDEVDGPGTGEMDNNSHNYDNEEDKDHTSKMRRLRRRLRNRRRKKVVRQVLDERGGPALVLGWLSQRQQFGVISMDKDLQRIQMHSSHQGQLLLPNTTTADGNNTVQLLQTDWAFAQLEAPHTYDEEPLVHFLRAVAGYNQAKPLQNGPLLTGWCSWYHYYENIDEESLRNNFATLSKLRKTCPTNVSVVDDGYMTAWGDWNSLKPGKFSSRDSMKAVADSIRHEKMRPGLWLAPFTCDKHSKLVREHPDWIIRNDQGIPANSSNCGKFFYGLDATNPQVLEYVYKCIRRAVQEWGYTVLKIDFLYAACLDGNGKYDLSLSRAQAMHLALHTIRSAAGPDTFLIGCGCPLASGVGYVDGMRISADTGPTWYPAFPLPWWDHATLPSLRGMIRNSITRAPLGHRWWHNDPDCLMLGSTTRLTLEEVASSASIVALTCGMLLLSDDLTKVSPARMKILTKIFPMTGVSAVVLDLHSVPDGHGLPTMLRLWCTDATQKREDFRKSIAQATALAVDRDHNEEAGFMSRFASFRLNAPLAHPNERQRSCIHMVKGLGTWTVLSLSNWLDTPAVVHIPPMALAPPPEAAAVTPPFRPPVIPQHGYHVFAFWSSKYSWISGIPDHPNSTAEGGQQEDAKSTTSADSEHTLLSKVLGPHETEIFHVKPVTPEHAQYLGSDLHFSCGVEVQLFHAEKNKLAIDLLTDYQRVGHVFVFVPIVSTGQVKAFCCGEPCRWTVVGNTPSVVEGRGPSTVMGRVLQVAVVCHADGRDMDGKVVIEF